MRCTWVTAVLPLVAVLATVAAPQCPFQKLAAADGAQNDNLGFSVSLSGDLALAGARGDDVVGANSGSAYVYRRSGALFAPVAKLVPTDAKPGDELGYACSLQGTLALVGARFEDVPGMDSGAAYVFEELLGAFVQTAKLEASDGFGGDQLGFAVAVGASTAVAGAPLHAHGGFQSGAVYVFERQGGAFAQVAELRASDAASGDRFGAALALAGERLLVGAHLDDDAGPSSNSGAVYVFERQGGVWVEVQKLTAGDAAPGDFFGFAVALDGDTALIGAPQDDDGGTNTGSGYVFERTPLGFAQSGKLTAFDAQASDQLGFSAALSGAFALLGAPFEDELGSGAGAAYLFERTPLGFVRKAKLLAPGGKSDDHLGIAVAAAGATALAGAHFADPIASGSGAVQTFALVTPPDALVACPGAISVTSGGTNVFMLQAPPSLAGEVYLLLGSISGTSPPFPVELVLVPLVPDVYTLATLAAPNTPPLAGSLGTLDVSGRALASFALPPGAGAGAVGLDFHHAFVVVVATPTLISVPFASNAAALRLVP